MQMAFAKILSTGRISISNQGIKKGTHKWMPHNTIIIFIISDAWQDV
jgi:hypothetical protein